MPPVIYVLYEPAEGQPKSYRFRSGMFTVGRDPGNDIIVPSTSVSRQHAKFLPAGNHWVLFDLKSTNGTWLNDVVVEGDHPVMLRNGDEIIFADARFSIRIRAEEGHPLPRYTKSLLVFDGDKFHSEFPLERAENVFTAGGPSAQFRIPGTTGEDILSIANQDGRIVAKPAPGYAGVARNKNAVLEPTELEDGDLLTFATARLIVNNNPRTVVGDDSNAPLENIVDAVNETPAYGDTGATVGVGASLGASSTQRAWGVEGDRRGTEGKGRRFIFGEGETRVDPNSTVTARPDQHGGRRERSPTDFDMNISRRVSSVPMPGERTAVQEKQRRIVIGVLFIAGSFVLALVAVVAVLLQ